MYVGSSDQRGRPRSISATPRCPYRRRKSARLVCSFGGRERPERQVHLRRRVVRERTHRHPPFVVGGEVSQELACEGIGRKTCGEDRGNVWQYLRRSTKQQSLGGGETFSGAGVWGHVARRA